MLQVQMEDSQQSPEETAAQTNEDSQDSQDDKVVSVTRAMPFYSTIDIDISNF